MLKRKLSEFSGVSMFRGTVCLDADDWTFEQAVRAEAKQSQRRDLGADADNGIAEQRILGFVRARSRSRNVAAI